MISRPGIARLLIQQAKKLVGDEEFDQVQSTFGYAVRDPFIVTVKEDNRSYTALWDEQLLCGGAKKRGDKWKLDRIPSSVQYFDSMKRAESELRYALRCDFVRGPMMCRTSISWQPNGSADVIDRWHLGEYTENAFQIGECGFLDKLVDAEKITSALFKTTDVDDVVRTFQSYRLPNPYFVRPKGNVFLKDGSRGFLQLGLGPYNDKFAIVADASSAQRTLRARGVTIHERPN